MGNIESFSYILPETILILTLVVLFIVNFFLADRGKSSTPLYLIITAVGVLLSLLAMAPLSQKAPSHLFMGMITYDGMSLFFRIFCGVASSVAIILSLRSQDLKGSDSAGYAILMVAMTLGMFFLVMAKHLLMIYLALEMVSITSYLLTGYVSGMRRSSEAALKYVIYGGVASGVMIYGFSLLYGLTGSLQLADIAEYLRFHPVDRPVLFLALLLSLVGFGFKISAFPFHMWAPDVYEGAPTPVTALLSVGPKAAGLAVLTRFVFIAFAVPVGGELIDIKSIGLTSVLSVLAIGTMTLGNLVALTQTNLKRLLAYSSIAHAGYMLMGLAALNQESLTALLFYLSVYLIMNLGAFAVVIFIANQFGAEELDHYNGLGRRAGSGMLVALAMAVFMFSLTGLPPTAGFIGKFYLFGAVMKEGLYALAVIGVLNSVISLYYYVRVIKVMFLDEAADDQPLAAPPLSYAALIGILAVATLYLGIFWQPVAVWVAESARFLY